MEKAKCLSNGSGSLRKQVREGKCISSAQYWLVLWEEQWGATEEAFERKHMPHRVRTSLATSGKRGLVLGRSTYFRAHTATWEHLPRDVSVVQDNGIMLRKVVE